MYESMRYIEGIDDARQAFFAQVDAIQGVGRHKMLFFRAGPFGLLFFSYFCTEKRSAIFTNKTSEHIHFLNIKKTIYEEIYPYMSGGGDDPGRQRTGDGYNRRNNLSA